MVGFFFFCSFVVLSGGGNEDGGNWSILDDAHIPFPGGGIDLTPPPPFPNQCFDETSLAQSSQKFMVLLGCSLAIFLQKTEETVVSKEQQIRQNNLWSHQQAKQLCRTVWGGIFFYLEVKMVLPADFWDKE